MGRVAHYGLFCWLNGVCERALIIFMARQKYKCQFQADFWNAWVFLVFLLDPGNAKDHRCVPVAVTWTEPEIWIMRTERVYGF